ncbi:hypothetical protein DMENIID0001_062390 [Sergentomyia squamirostris]
MKYFLIFMVISVTVKGNLFDGNFVDDDDDELDKQVQLISVDRLADFTKNNPGLELEMLQMSSGYRGQIYYTLGNRQRGDRLVATAANNQHWPRPQNAVVQIGYPARGVGALVTYVSVNVTQSSNLGQAYVTKGGINQRNITIVVESYGTTFLNYVCNIFGI